MINEQLLQLFQAHGVNGFHEDDSILFPDTGLKAFAWIPNKNEYQDGFSVKLDIGLDVSPGRRVFEKFVGVGETSDAAREDAMRQFASSTLPVMLAAYFGIDCEGASREEWTIGGAVRTVFVGDMGTRVKLPAQASDLAGWYSKTKELVEAQNLNGKMHWIWLYSAHDAGKPTGCEARLDNEEWQPLQSELAAVKLPRGDAFYDVRLFLVVDGGWEIELTPEAVLHTLVGIINLVKDADGEELCARLEYTGVPRAVADRACMFTQIAWGRALTDGMGVIGSPEYNYFDKDGEIVESGLLEEEPDFVEARRLAPECANLPAFQTVAIASADIAALNDLVRQGGKMKGVMLAPTSIFAEAPTARGAERAREYAAQRLAELKPDYPEAAKLTERKSAPPKWQFWKR